MGTLRLLLALAVFSGHVTRDHPLLGIIAVKAFFVLSGFTIALVLEKKYQGKYRLFIRNRFLRLYPSYIVIALCALPFAGTGPFITLWNLSMVGTDVLYFFQKMTHQTYLLIPTAWSIGVEIWFYLLAPFLVRLQSHWLVALALGSIAFRLHFAANGFHGDIWEYRFFPFELVFFLIGILMYRAWPRLFAFSQKSAVDRWLGELSYPFYLVHVFVIQISPIDALFNSLAISALLVLLVERPIARWRASPRFA